MEIVNQKQYHNPDSTAERCRGGGFYRISLIIPLSGQCRRQVIIENDGWLLKFQLDNDSDCSCFTRMWWPYLNKLVHFLLCGMHLWV